MKRLGFWVALIVVLGLLSKAEGKVLAKGEGFVVEDRELKALESSFKGPWKPSEKALLHYLVKVKLFAKRAEELGLGKGVKGPVSEGKLYSAYRKYLVENYKVPEDAVVSYYLAHWRRFVKRESGVCSDLSKLPLRGLDEVRADIEALIKERKARLLEEEEYARLLKKYHVKFCGEGAGC